MLKRCIIVLMCFALAACGGATRAPVQDRSLTTNSQPSPNEYIVRKGDTLYSIAFRYGLNWRQLARQNDIDTSYSIFPGQRLTLKTPQPRSEESIVRDASINQAKPQIVRNTAATIQQKPKAAVQTAKTAPSPSQIPAPKIVKKTAKTTTTSKPVIPAGPIRWQWPAPGRVIAGYRTKGTVNKGINISGAKGSSVQAAAKGRVVYAGNGLLGYGNLVIIDHDRQYLSAYAHNSRVLVKESDIVKAGQKIAEMGSSGADRVMLHFEIRRDGKPMNPLRYLPKR